MPALDEMADGNFDARLPGISGKEDEVNEYNAILGRIQTRIFNQQTRNTAIGVIMNQMQNGIVAVDQDLNIMLITPVAKKFLGRYFRKQIRIGINETDGTGMLGGRKRFHLHRI